jgi:hypothetical protein
MFALNKNEIKMKAKFLILPALLLVLGSTSCDKDDDKYELPAATLTGKWFYSQVGTTIGGAEVLGAYDGNEDGCSKDYIELGNDGEYANVDYDSADTPCAVSTQTGSFAVTGNSFVVDTGDDTVTGTILNLSYTELKIRDNDSGAIVVYTRS